MKRILTVVAAVTALAAIGAAPAMASQAAPAQSTGTCCGLAAAEGLAVVKTAAVGSQYNIDNVVDAEFADAPLLGRVNSTWPFSNPHFDSLYAGDEVRQFQQVNGSSNGCMQTDSVHSGVFDNPCGSHNAGTYWVFVNSGAIGVCTNGAAWLVNVGITNHYPVYPYGYAMFINTNDFIYTQSHRPLGGDDQWCRFTFS